MMPHELSALLASGTERSPSCHPLTSKTVQYNRRNRLFRQARPLRGRVRVFLRAVHLNVGTKPVSNLCACFFAFGTFLGGVLGETWHMRRDPHYSPPYGIGVDIFGLAAFALLYAVVIYIYGSISLAIRKGDTVIRTYLVSALIGLPFWFVILPLSTFTRDRLGFPDALWWLESAFYCILSFEIIRVLNKLTKKHA